ncbi:polysaccharide pyruvyl transferase family protein [Bacteroides sp. GD17]|jgi:polysaccharide pyruvyl transferase WcaK-like protein|uniref:polysaccharide pyruvyl transferase family protein n=1 Tax=Bacteroides sp. GD17 TaxID=3139826 RepID=UPI0025CBE88B|nr:polysaccharide pyruvyl transferase family protein [uncultured Bacteroides sp.]
MKIVLSGLGTTNKGAELMLYAILQQIELKYPQAEVFISKKSVRPEYVDTRISLKYKPYSKWKAIAIRSKIRGIFRILHLPTHIFSDTTVVENADYFIDGSGFVFSDQWNLNFSALYYWEHILRSYHEQGTKIIFLPQAFGPVEKEFTRKIISCIDKYADVVMPREMVSKNYLAQCFINQDKIKLFTDFTSLVEGRFPEKYASLRDAVCIIPNMRMIDKGMISMEDYLAALLRIVRLAKSYGKQVYLLNHEGMADEKLAFSVQQHLNDNIEVVTGLNALEVKGLIASSFLCITSRFHGVASALNSCVPCLATSWSHKYEELFRDYGLENSILELNNVDDKIVEYLQPENNRLIRQHLEKQVTKIKEQTSQMWKIVWNE